MKSFPMSTRGMISRAMGEGGQSGSSFSPLSLSPLAWARSSISTLYQDSAGTTPVTGAGQGVGKRVDQSGNGNDWTQVTATARPIYDGTALVYSVDDALVMTVPPGGLAGTFVQATTEGVIVGTYSRAAGAYQMPVNTSYPGAVQNDVGQLYFDRVLTAPEIANLVQWLKGKEGAGSGVYSGSLINWLRDRNDIVTLDGNTIDVSGVLDFTAAWQSCTGLTTFPSLDMSSGTNFNSAWSNCTGLTAFPSLDVGAGTSFMNTWNGCAGLTAFPLLDVSAGTNFYGAWQGCSSLTAFPLLNVSAGRSFENAWRDCSSLANFPANFFSGCTATDFENAFIFTNLSQTSIDNILVSINSNGTVNGRFDQSGGSAPSATGEAAIDAMRSRGWTVIVTGGY